MPEPHHEILFIGALVAAVSVVSTPIGASTWEEIALKTGVTFGVIAIILIVATGAT